MKKFKDLSKRLIIGSLAVFFMIFLIYFSDYKYFYPFFVLFVTGICVVVLWEFLSIIEKKNIFLEKKILVPASILLVISFSIKNIFIFSIDVFVLVFILLFFCRIKKIKGSLEYFSFSIFSLIYTVIPFCLIFPILSFGKIYIVYLIVVTKIVDVGGYFIGRLFGRKKLIENISPNKTGEGAVFGFFLAFISSIIFSFFSFFSLKLGIILGIIFGVTSQIGDLVESLFKRDADVKDSSFLPAIGGFLDMTDSLLINIPIFYVLLEWMR